MLKLILINDEIFDKLLNDFGERRMEEGIMQLITLVEYGAKILQESDNENNFDIDLLNKDGVFIYNTKENYFYN